MADWFNSCRGAKESQKQKWISLCASVQEVCSIDACPPRTWSSCVSSTLTGHAQRPEHINSIVFSLLTCVWTSSLLLGLWLIASHPPCCTRAPQHVRPQRMEMNETAVPGFLYCDTWKYWFPELGFLLDRYPALSLTSAWLPLAIHLPGRALLIQRREVWQSTLPDWPNELNSHRERPIGAASRVRPSISIAP